MSGTLVADLGLGPEVWLFLTLLACVTIFFKFTRLWSVRNLDLLLLFAPAPGMMVLVGSGSVQPWTAFAWLFLGSLSWLARCLLDLGLSRRPLLEPNLNGVGLSCLVVGLLGLMAAETMSLPVDEGAKRNPADPSPKTPGGVPTPLARVKDPGGAVGQVLSQAPLPQALRRKPPQVIVSRVLACLAHIGLVAALIAVGSRQFERPIAGLSAAACYLVLPYSRIALVDSGQLVPAALIVAALVVVGRPLAAGALIGLAAGWMPAALGLVPLWAGFYYEKGALRFLGVSLGVVILCATAGLALPELGAWARALGARSLEDAGMLPGLDAAPRAGSFWADIEPAYRLPVLIAYLALVGVTSVWPAGKNLGELIALSAALLVASQFWYLDEGGTLVLLYLPLLLLMVFRPSLAARRPILRPSLAHAAPRPAPSER